MILILLVFYLFIFILFCFISYKWFYFMKKNIIFIIIFVLLLLLFIWLNYKFFLAKNYFSNSNNYYKNTIFTWALDSYNKTSSYLNDSNIEYNKWNTFYKLSESEKDMNKKIKLLNDSINSYS